VVIGPKNVCSCYWQMPHRCHVHITLENQAAQDASAVAYRILYKLHPAPDQEAYFHARWWRTLTAWDDPQHTILLPPSQIQTALATEVSSVLSRGHNPVGLLHRYGFSAMKGSGRGCLRIRAA
jgi:Protein of unknown function (DUF2961)